MRSSAGCKCGGGEGNLRRDRRVQNSCLGEGESNLLEKKSQLFCWEKFHAHLRSVVIQTNQAGFVILSADMKNRDRGFLSDILSGK